MSRTEDTYWEQSNEASAQPIEVPPEALASDTVDALIESFILREGTDYGSVEISLDTKKAQVHKQLKNGDIKITFDPNTETVTLMTLKQWKTFLLTSQK